MKLLEPPQQQLMMDDFWIVIVQFLYPLLGFEADDRLAEDDVVEDRVRSVLSPIAAEDIFQDIGDDDTERDEMGGPWGAGEDMLADPSPRC